MDSVLKFGLMDFGDQANEKTVHNYTPILGSTSPEVALSYQLGATYNPGVTPTDLLSPIATFPTPNADNFLTLYFMAIYFQETLTVTEAGDKDFRLSTRIYEVDRIQGRGVTRRPD